MTYLDLIDKKAFTRNQSYIEKLLRTNDLGAFELPCGGCKKPLSIQQTIMFFLYQINTRIACSYCNERVFGAVWKREESVIRKSNPENYIWYHSTDKDFEIWKSSIASGEQQTIHFGEFFSAIHRAVLHNRKLAFTEENSFINIFTVTLEKDFSFKGVIDDPGTTNWNPNPQANEVFSYKNNCEAPGSTAIATGHKAINFQNREVINFNNFREELGSLLGVSLFKSHLSYQNTPYPERSKDTLCMLSI